MFARSKTPKDRETNTSDLIKRTVASKMSSIVVMTRGGSVPVTEYNGRVRLPDGTYWNVTVVAVGYTAKKGSEQKMLTTVQLRYVCELCV